MRSLTLLFALVFAAAPAWSQSDNRSVVVKNTPEGFVLTDVTDAPVDDAPAVLLSAPADGSRGWSMRALSPGDNPADVLARRGDLSEARAHHEMARALQREGADRHRIVSEYHRGRLARQRDAVSDVVGDGEIVELTDEAEIMDDGEIVEWMDDAEIVGDGEIVETDDAFSVFLDDGEISDVRRTPARALLRSIEARSAGTRAVRHEVRAELDRPLALDDPLVAALVADESLSGLEVTESDGTTHLQIDFSFRSVSEWKAWLAESSSVETVRAIRDLAKDSMTRTKVDVR